MSQLVNENDFFAYVFLIIGKLNLQTNQATIRNKTCQKITLFVSLFYPEPPF